MTRLQLEMSLAAAFTFIIILIFLKKNSLSVKNSIAWLLLPLACLLIAIFPDPLAKFSGWLGFQAPSNFFFVILIGILFLICFFLTISISHQQAKINKLIQEMSILKQKDTKNDKKK